MPTGAGCRSGGERGGAVKGWARLRQHDRAGSGIAEGDTPDELEPATGERLHAASLALNGNAVQRREEPAQVRAMRWQRDLARAHAERWRLEHVRAVRERDESDARREALLKALTDALPDAVLGWRMRGWDQGWEAAHAGYGKRQNPHRRAAAAPRAAAEDTDVDAEVDPEIGPAAAS